MRTWGIVVGTAFALGAWGCSETAVDIRPLRVERDTVGGTVFVRYVGVPVRSHVEPLVSVGVVGAPQGEAPPDEFGRIESVIADPGERFYVADGIALEIRVFDADGEFAYRFGRKGQGPGEFEGLHGIAWLTADTIVAMDFGNARLSLLTASGESLRQWPWMRLTGSPRFLFNGGPGEIYAHTFRPRSPGEERSRSAWVRYTGSGPQDTLDIPVVDPRPGASVVCRGDGIGFMENPFGDQFLSRPAPNGERVLAWSSEYRLAFVSPTGDTLRMITREVSPRPIADPDWAPVAEEYTRYRETWQGAVCEGEISRPDSHPVLEDIVFDADGRTLVEYMTNSGPAFDLFGMDGEWLATFASPEDRDQSVAPFLRGDHLYLVQEDRLGVQRVEVYRVDDAEGW